MLSRHSGHNEFGEGTPSTCPLCPQLHVKSQVGAGGPHWVQGPRTDVWRTGSLSQGRLPEPLQRSTPTAASCTLPECSGWTALDRGPGALTAPPAPPAPEACRTWRPRPRTLLAANVLCVKSFTECPGSHHFSTLGTRWLAGSHCPVQSHSRWPLWGSAGAGWASLHPMGCSMGNWLHSG